MPAETSFQPRTSVEHVEEGPGLRPRAGEHGLLPCATTDAAGGKVPMLGWMNAEALQRTLATHEAHCWSRSRRVLWHKGATSGLVQRVMEVRVDDDQDAVWLRVQVQPGHDSPPAACHVGHRSCFCRTIDPDTGALRYVEQEKTFDPRVVYGDAPNPMLL